MNSRYHLSKLFFILVLFPISVLSQESLESTPENTVEKLEEKIENPKVKIKENLNTGLIKSIQLNEFSLNITKNQEGGFSADFIGLSAEKEILSELIPNPSRLVLDIIGVPSKTAYNVSINSDGINKVRIGIHRDKTRVVFDLQSSTEKVQFTKNTDISNNGQPIIRFILKDSSPSLSQATTEVTHIEEEVLEEKSPDEKTPVEKSPEEKVPSSSSSKSPSSTKSAAVSSSLSPSASPSGSPSSSAKVVSTSSLPLPEASIHSDPVTPASLSSKENLSQKEIDSISNFTAVLKSLVFQTTSDQIQSSIVLSVNPFDQHELKKTSERFYELYLPQVKLRSETLSLPQYPPDSFKGYVYMLAEQNSNGVIVKIMVEPGVSLTSYVAQGKLWVRTN